MPQELGPTLISTPLLSVLPLELREQIYAFALGGRAFYIFTHHHGLGSRPYEDGISNLCTCIAIHRTCANPTGNWWCKLVRPRKEARLNKARFLDLLYACKQIYFEARLCLYAYTDFHTVDPAVLPELRTSWAPEHIASIRRLTCPLHFVGSNSSSNSRFHLGPQTPLRQTHAYYRRLSAARELQASLLAMRGLRSLRLVCHVRDCYDVEEDALCELLREMVVRMPGVLTLDFGHGYGGAGEPVGLRRKLSVALGMQDGEENQGAGMLWENLRCVEVG